MSTATPPHDEQAFVEFSELVFQLYGSVTASSSSQKTPTGELSFAEEDAVRMSEVLKKEDAADLYGMELDRALKDRQLPVSGTVDEKKRWLQERFDAELEDRIAERLVKERKEKTKKVEAALRERRMSSWCTTVQEEVQALEKAPGIRRLLSLAKQHQGPTHLEPKVDKVLSRALSKSLFRDSYILQLDLSGCPIGDESAAFVARAVRKNRTLLTLALNRCACGIVFLKNMAKSLVANKTLQCLSLEHNTGLAPLSVSPMVDDSDTPRRDISGVVSFSKSLRKNSNLRCLSIFGCHLGASAGAVLLEGMEANTGLISLQTAYNDFHPAVDRSMTDRAQQNRMAKMETKTAEGWRSAEELQAVDKEKKRDEEKAKRQGEQGRLLGESKARADERQLLALVDVEEEKAEDLSAEHQKIIECLSRTYWPKSGKKQKKKKRGTAAELSSGIFARNIHGIQMQEVPGFRADYVEGAAAQRRAELKSAKAAAAAAKTKK